MPRSVPSPPADLPRNITHDARVIDIHSGVTQAELAEYYHAVRQWLLPHLAGRPVALLRAPEGPGAKVFFQRHAATPITAIPWPELPPESGREPLMQIDDTRALVAAVHMGTVEFHTWNARGDLIERPDRVIFALVPGQGVRFAQLVEAAQLLRGFLDALALQSFVKTSGGRSLHVVTPLARRHTWESARRFAEGFAKHLADVLPTRFTATMGAKHRVGKCFIDYLHNYRGATTICACSARARDGLAVSMPVRWDELPALSGAAAWHVKNALERLRSLRQDPWADYAQASQQRLTQSILARLDH